MTVRLIVDLEGQHVPVEEVYILIG